MDNKQEEFFEAFEIPKIKNIENNCINPKYKKQGGFLPKSFCRFECNSCEYCIQKHDIYPPITSDIILKLEEIIIKAENNIYYEYCFDGDAKCCCYLMCDEFLHEEYGRTRKDALLNLCIKLKDEIKNEVRSLFNEQ